MVSDCSASCARWLLCLANFTFLAISGAVLAVGTWLSFHKASFIDLTLNITTSKFSPASNFVDDEAEQILKEFVEPAVIEQAGYILLALGGFIFILSFLGYCGSIKESRVLLTTYGIFLIIIFALQVCLILLCSIYKSQATDHSKKFLKSSLSDHYSSSHNKNGVSLGWDMVMAHLSCCGVEDYTDFDTAKIFIEKSKLEGLGRKVPESCCKLKGDPLLLRPEDPTCIISPDDSNSYLNIGCYNRLSEMIVENLDLVIAAVVIVAGVQLLAIILAFCLCRAVGKDRDYHYKY